MNKFGEQIRQFRKSKKLTLRALAEMSNLSYSFIASLEKGRYNPSRESIYSIAKPLGADVNELLMLAGFLPDQHDTNENQQSKHSEFTSSSETFELEDIMKLQVTFEGKRVKEADKIALLAFLQTIAGMKSSE
ncbi:helix-turn-helix transcriptional regulator [Sporosarcina sp.]|uniref:helix-turn-helix domain-containing protein n=1 Tax=Sporosarcina sp. TaxID=49982 RepID=UPI002605101D|nr:helix-turn-helix transcriptional regulator [Sporosarcina sp.]